MIDALEPRTMLAYVPRVVAYFPEYRWSTFAWQDLEAVSHLNYFSISANADGSLATPNIDTSHMTTLVSAAHAKNVTVSITVGPQSFATIAGNATALNTFTTNVTNFCTTWNLDGIDIDWEPSPGQNVAAYKTLIDALYAKSHPLGLYLSAAVNPLNKEIPPAAIPEMDWINVMCYDFDFANHSTMTASTNAMNAWNTWGAPKDKLVMGMPFYGRAGTSWGNSTPKTYTEIVNRYATLNGGAKPAANVDSVTINFPDAFAGANMTWYFNGQTTIQSKANFVKTNGYGGVMIWEIGQDDFTGGGVYTPQALLPAIKSALQPSFAKVDASNNVVIDGSRLSESWTLSTSGTNLVLTRTGNAGSLAFALSSVNGIVVNGGLGNDSLTVNDAGGKPLTFNGGTGNDTLNVNGGTVTFNADAQAGTTNLTVNVSAGGAVLFNTTQHLAALNIDGGLASLAPVGAGGSRAIVTRSISFVNNGRLDLADGAIIVDYTVPTPSPLAMIRAAIAAGYNAGHYNGPVGIVSTVAAATPGRGLGYTEASAFFSVFPAVFAGQQIDSTSVLVGHTLAGDSNFDRRVDLVDFTVLAANFNGTNKGWIQGDFNYDGAVDLTDFTFLASNFNQSLPGAPAAALARVAPATPSAPPTAPTKIFPPLSDPIDSLAFDLIA